jgi:hypothetical protein
VRWAAPILTQGDVLAYFNLAVSMSRRKDLRVLLSSIGRVGGQEILPSSLRLAALQVPLDGAEIA